MFDVGWQELFILAVLAIIVIGPKDLPRAMRTITGWLRKLRSLARDFQDGLDEVAREADLQDLKSELDRPGGLDVGKKIGEYVDPTGEIADDYDLDKDVYDEMSDAVDDLKDATAPDEVADKAPDKTPDKTPDKAPDKTPDKAPDKTPDKAADKAAEKAADKTPATADAAAAEPEAAKKASG